MQLFERGAKGARATAAGGEVLAQARRVLGEAHDLEILAASLVDPYAAVLRVGVIPTVAPYLLHHVMARLSEQERSPRIHWVELQTADAKAELVDGRLDAALIADRPSAAGLAHEGIGWEPFFAVLPQGPAPAAMDPSRFDDQPVLLLEDGHCLRDHALAQCMTPQATESPYRATSLPTVVQMVASGFGVSVLPASAVEQETRRAKVQAVPFAGRVGRTLQLLWREQSPRAAVIREVGEALEQALADAT